MNEDASTLVGRVRSRDDDGDAELLLFDVRMSIDDDDERRFRGRRVFELETDGGDRARVDVARAELLPHREVEGRFGELLEDPLAQAVLDSAPGDHVRVLLRGAVVAEGTRVHVDGRVRTEPDGMTHVTAVALATGPDAETLLHDSAQQEREREAKAKAKAEREPEPEPLPAPVSTGPALGLAVALALAGAGALALGPRAEPYEQAVRLVGPSLLAAGVFTWRRRRWLPSLSPYGRSESGTGLRWRVGPWLWITVLVALFAGGATAFGAVSSSTNSTDVFLGSAGPFVLAMLPLVLLGGLLHSDWSSLRRAVLMLRTKPLGVDATRGTFGYFVGTAEEDAKMSWSFSKTTTESRTERRAEDGTIEVSHSTSTSFGWTRTTSSARRCTVSIGDDAVAVELEGALFGALRRRLEYPTKTQYLPGGHRTSSSSSETVAYATLTESMVSGDSVFVVGRVKREGERLRLEATGEESLFVFSAPTDARAVLRAQAIAGAAGLVSLVGLAGVGFALALG